MVIYRLKVLSLIFLFLLFLYYIRPVLHPIIMIFCDNPFITVALISLFVSVVISIFSVRFSDTWFGVSVVMIIIYVIIGMFYTTYVSIGKVGELYEPILINYIPRTDLTLLPVSKSNYVTIDNVQLSKRHTVKIGNGIYDVYVAKTSTSSISRILFVQINKDDGIIFVESPKFKYTESYFSANNYRYQLYKQKYFVRYSEPIYLFCNNRLTMVVPYSTFKIFWSWVYPYTIWYWDGVVMITDEDVTFIPRENIKYYQCLLDQPLLPPKLIKDNLTKYLLSNGWNKKKSYLSEKLFEQPYLTWTNEGLVYYFVSVNRNDNKIRLYYAYSNDDRIYKYTKLIAVDPNDLPKYIKKYISYPEISLGKPYLVYKSRDSAFWYNLVTFNDQKMYSFVDVFDGDIYLYKKLNLDQNIQIPLESIQSLSLIDKMIIKLMDGQVFTFDVKKLFKRERGNNYDYSN